MFLIIAKISPTQPGAKYLTFDEIEHILDKNNLDQNVPIIPSEYFDTGIFAEWLINLSVYKSFLLDSLLVYQVFKDNDTIFTLQYYFNSESFNKFSLTPEYKDYLNIRKRLLEMLKVKLEIEHIELSDNDPEHYFFSTFDEVNSYFNSIYK